MNSQTKIVVIRMKWLIIAVIAAIVLIAGIVLYFNMGKNDSGSSSGNARTTSSDVKSAADTDSSDVRNSTYKNSPVTYTPGVYTASIMLDGNPVDIKVTLDKNNIKKIKNGQPNEENITDIQLFFRYHKDVNINSVFTEISGLENVTDLEEG